MFYTKPEQNAEMRKFRRMWDTPISALPIGAEPMIDPILAQFFTVRDFLSHRTGVPDYTIASYGPSIDRNVLWKYLCVANLFVLLLGIVNNTILVLLVT